LLENTETRMRTTRPRAMRTLNMVENMSAYGVRYRRMGLSGE
jgi:hypothetical protein